MELRRAVKDARVAILSGAFRIGVALYPDALRGTGNAADGLGMYARRRAVLRRACGSPSAVCVMCAAYGGRTCTTRL